MLTPNSIVLGTDEVYRRGGPTVSLVHYLFHCVGCRVIDRRYSPHLTGVRTLLRIDIGDNHFARYCGRRNVHSAAPDAARANDHQVVVSAQMPARPFECRKRRNAGAGVRRSKVLRHALMGKKVAAIWHDHVCAIAASASGAKGTRVEA
jgi:hypothetical protein